MTRVEEAKAWALSHVGCPYVYGATGAACTPEYRQARAAQYPDYAAKIRKNCPRLSGSASSCSGCRWADAETGQGLPAFDCAQLTRRCMEHVGLVMVSGAHSQWTKTAWEAAGEIGTIPRDKLCLVYRYDESKGRMGHTGIYLGDGTIVHAKGHDYGVVRELLGVPTFSHWGIPAGLYGALPPAESYILRQGDQGEAIRELQQRLTAHGYALNADGIFGAKTAAAVKAFQKAAGLTQDGIAGPNTWAAMGAAAPAPQDPSQPAPDPDWVSVPRNDLAAKRRALEELIAWINQVLEG